MKTYQIILYITDGEDIDTVSCSVEADSKQEAIDASINSQSNQVKSKIIGYLTV